MALSKDGAARAAIFDRRHCCLKDNISRLKGLLGIGERKKEGEGRHTGGLVTFGHRWYVSFHFHCFVYELYSHVVPFFSLSFL